MGARDAGELVRQKRARWLRAVRFEKQDRVPITLAADGYAARQAGITYAQYIGDWDLYVRATIDALTKWGEIDGTDWTLWPPQFFSFGSNIPIKLPGRELPDDVLWQLDERCLVGPEVYDEILDVGWNEWLERFQAQNFADAFGVFEEFGEAYPRSIAEWEAVGVPCANVDAAGLPMELLCGARSMKEFMLDLHRMPDKVQAVMDVAIKDIVARIVPETYTTGGLACEVVATRGSSDILSPRLWDRFVFPYLEQVVEAAIAAGGVPYFHFDGDWNRVLPRFLELPAKSCVLMLDSRTDIFRAREILGDHMCLKGDVPPSLLSLGTPEKVRSYCDRLVREVGPEGLILSQACTIPPDAEAENVRAMVESVSA